MNYYAPRQKQIDKLWHYTCMNDGQIWPVGYCADSCSGHVTEKEAREHYKRYLLEKRIEFSKHENQQRRCKECNVYTEGYVSIDGWPKFDLCEQHQTKEIVEKFLTVGTSMSS